MQCPDLSYKWNHIHPPKCPSVFEVRNHGILISNTTFKAGINISEKLKKEYENQLLTAKNNMSGGHFEYKQYHVDELAAEIDRLIAKVHKTREDVKDTPDDPCDPNYCWEKHYLYSDETLAKFAEARDTLKRAAIMAQRVDWLVSGDDGEQTFHQRWKEELKQYETSNI